MSLPHEIEYEVSNFVKPKLVFNLQYNQFKYDEKWIIDIDEDHFKRKLLPVVEKINEQLITGINNDTFLSYLIKLIEKKGDWFYEIRINQFDQLKTLKNEIRIDKSISIDGPSKEIITIDILNQPKPASASRSR